MRTLAESQVDFHKFFLPDMLLMRNTSAKRCVDITPYQTRYSGITYADINAEAIFFTCKDKIPQLQKTIQKMVTDLK